VLLEGHAVAHRWWCRYRCLRLYSVERHHLVGIESRGGGGGAKGLQALGQEVDEPQRRPEGVDAAFVYDPDPLFAAHR
jgi:hypothetical protein